MWLRVWKTLTAIFWGQAVTLAGNITLVPLYLTYWTPEVYGEWLTLLALAGYFYVLDLGLTLVSTNRLTQTYAVGRLKEYARCQHSVFAFFVSISLISTMLLAVTLWVFPLPSWLGINHTSQKNTNWILWLLSQNVLWAMPAGFIWAVYRTAGKASKSQWLFNAHQFVSLGLISLILINSGGMTAVAMSQFVVLVLVTLYAYLDLRARFPDLVPGLKNADHGVLSGLIQPGLLFGLLTVGNVITTHGSVTILSNMLSGVAVAVFVTSRTLVNIIRQIVGSLINAFWTEITAMEARAEWDGLRTLHRLLMAGSTTLCVGFATVLWYEGTEIFTVWTRGKLQPDAVLLRLLLAFLVLQSTWLVSLAFTAATNQHQRLSLSYIVSAIIGVGFGAFLLRWIGTWAIPIGLIVGEALACYHYVIKNTCEIIGEPYRSFSLRLWLGMAAMSSLSLLSGWIAHENIPGPLPIRCIGVGMFSITATATVAWRIWLAPNERTRLVSIFCSLERPLARRHLHL
jgi:O-antigen/teichoic acid export membrane protein